MPKVEGIFSKNALVLVRPQISSSCGGERDQNPPTACNTWRLKPSWPQLLTHFTLVEKIMEWNYSLAFNTLKAMITMPP